MNWLLIVRRVKCGLEKHRYKKSRNQFSDFWIFYKLTFPIYSELLPQF